MMVTGECETGRSRSRRGAEEGPRARGGVTTAAATGGGRSSGSGRCGTCRECGEGAGGGRAARRGMRSRVCAEGDW
jgi:hypothetical protein